MTDTLFNTPDQGTPELVDGSYVKTLVGEDKKYKDAESLAKATLEKEKHIQKIEAENALYAQKLSKTETIEELLAKQQELFKKQESTVPSNQETPLAEVVTPTTPEHKEQDISALVAQELERRTQEQTKAQNLDTVKSEMQKTFGAEALQVWNLIKESSGMSEEGLRELATKSPQGVLQLAKASAPVGTPQPTPNLFGTTIDPSKVSAQGTALIDAKPNSYWKELKAQNGGILTGAQNRERLNARMLLEDKFWD